MFLQVTLHLSGFGVDERKHKKSGKRHSKGVVFMKIVLLGGPGAGKGTQSKILSKHYQVDHISTGDLLREHMRNKTEIGLAIQDQMDAGHFVPDEMIIELLKERISTCENGFVLDGFPRTLVQAEVLDEVAGKIDKIVLIDVPDSYVIERMSGRYSCVDCGAMYHTKYNPPNKPMTCDVCEAHLIQRVDDRARTVENRLKIFHDLTKPIIDYFRNKNMLIEVSGVGHIDDITKTIVAELGD